MYWTLNTLNTSICVSRNSNLSHEPFSSDSSPFLLFYFFAFLLFVFVAFFYVMSAQSTEIMNDVNVHMNENVNVKEVEKLLLCRRKGLRL